MIYIDLTLPEEAGTTRGVMDVRAFGEALVRDKAVRRAAGALAVVVGVCVLGEMYLGVQVERAGAKVETAQADSARVEAVLVHMRQLEEERGRLGSAADAVLALDLARDAWPRLLDRLSRVTPEYVWVDEARMGSVDPATGTFTFSLSGVGGSVDQVIRLERALIGGPVKSAMLIGSSPVQVAGVTLLRWNIEGTAGAASVGNPNARVTVSEIPKYETMEGANTLSLAPLPQGPR